MSSASKATIISVGFVGSILLYQVLAQNTRDKIKSSKPSKRELEQKCRKQIQIITGNIAILHGHNNKSKQHNLMYHDVYFGKILEFLTTFEYLNTMCRLSKYHYLFLNHKGINYEKNKTVTFNMLLNESCYSWNIDKIQLIFNKTRLVDIYNFMYFISNNWKWSGCSKTIKNNRHSEIIEQMICIPYIVPNVSVVKHWFNYISFKLNIPIHDICFKSEMGPNPRHKKSLKHYFMSLNENPYEMHLFIWIIVYNLYQLYSEINTQSVSRNKQHNQKKSTRQSAMHPDYFGFEHSLQRWLVDDHHFHILNSDITALLKLFNMMTYNKECHVCIGFNMIFIFCIMFKIILHNTELHIIKFNQNRCIYSLDNVNQIRDIFLHNLNNIMIFTQYIIEKCGKAYDEANIERKFRIFHMLLNNFKIPAMIKNVLNWFSKLNKNNNVFYIYKDNPFFIDLSSASIALFGLKTRLYSKDSVLNDQITIWV